MNPEVKAKWLAALRSGEYKQGRGQLHTPGNTFCCLGVLCDLAFNEGVVTRREDGGGFSYGQGGGPLRNLGYPNYLPPEVQEWAGIPTSNPGVSWGKKLSEYNDEGESFEFIADLIEEHL